MPEHKKTSKLNVSFGTDPFRRENSTSSLEEKLLNALNSPVLNGGFEELVANVNYLTETQKVLIAKVDQIHESVYHPDVGLYARIKSSERMSEKEIFELQNWKTTINKEIEEDIVDNKEIKLKISVLDSIVKELQTRQLKTVAVLKWLGVALAGGFVSMLFSWLSTKL